MNTYNGFNLRDSITAAIGSLTAVTFSVVFAATCLVGTVAPSGAATSAQGYTIVSSQA
jgi:hypothetical protein